jgi:hypothetical protein
MEEDKKNAKTYNFETTFYTYHESSANNQGNKSLDVDSMAPKPGYRSGRK